MIHPNLLQLSHSSLLDLHSCPRYYELTKLTDRLDEWGDPHLDFGKILGNAIQHYLTYKDRDAAYYLIYKEWQSGIDDGVEEGRIKSNKTFWHALHAVDRFIPLALSRFDDYEVAYLNGRPATELGFCIDCGDGVEYRGFVDTVMIHKYKKRLVPIELKTTSSWNVNEANYKNSGQGLGYSLMLDVVAGALDLEVTSDYPVIYPVYRTKDYDWEVFEFTKSKTARARWIQNLLLDKEMLLRYGTLDFFPMHGENCMAFGRQCKYFGMCELSNKSVAPNPKLRVEQKDKYDFYFSLEDIINQQLAQLGE